MPEVTHRILARVMWHENGGFTRVALEPWGWDQEIPTEVIPTDLRKIGDRFWLLMHKVCHDSPEALRESLDYMYAVERLIDGSA